MKKYQIYEVTKHTKLIVNGFNSNDYFTCEVWIKHLKCEHPKRDYIIVEE